MSIHIVQVGESLARIAHKYRISDWRSIYQHPQNARLRSLRPNPALLRPGDRVFIPGPKQGGEPPSNIQSTAPRPPPPWQEPDSEVDERDLSLLSTWLIREGYVERVSKVIPANWRALPEEQLTKLLAQKYSEDQIKKQFLEAYAKRTGIKATFRKLSVISALVIGLVWARENTMSS